MTVWSFYRLTHLHHKSLPESIPPQASSQPHLETAGLQHSVAGRQRAAFALKSFHPFHQLLTFSSPCCKQGPGDQQGLGALHHDWHSSVLKNSMLSTPSIQPHTVIFILCQDTEKTSPGCLGINHWFIYLPSQYKSSAVLPKITPRAVDRAFVSEVE